MWNVAHGFLCNDYDFDCKECNRKWLVSVIMELDTPDSFEHVIKVFFEERNEKT
jgi:hypothetical protein